ncbi:hypothetical protein B0H13DRAFT_1729945 [Mycena leptocephala]|nr:hypothetical protein B0H13DRAFT_1729945 [Mycena leptocephala]
MCYASGSLDQAVNACSMCKVFPRARSVTPVGCPHTRDVCRNRIAHPGFDVIYLKNAEVDSFNGCGYCKWANTSPPPKASGYYNTGWPGCCRAPTTSEHRLIQLADWRSVSLVHHVLIPPNVKAALDNPPSRGSPVPSTSLVGSGRSAKPSIPSVDRRDSGSGVAATSATVPIPTDSRSGGSPQMVVTSTSTSSRGPGGSAGGTSTSVLTTSTVRIRQENIAESEKSPGSNSPRNSGGRPPPSTALPSRVIVDALSSGTQERRFPSSSQSFAPTKVSQASPPIRPVDRPRGQKKADADTSSASGSSGGDSLGTDKTSDGGFTDYLSDESEAELQRQAEAKAALVAQNEAEELEFRAARQALANIGLRPPKGWASTQALTGRRHK